MGVSCSYACLRTTLETFFRILFLPTIPALLLFYHFYFNELCETWLIIFTFACKHFHSFQSSNSLTIQRLSPYPKRGKLKSKNNWRKMRKGTKAILSVTQLLLVCYCLSLRLNQITNLHTFSNNSTKELGRFQATINTPFPSFSILYHTNAFFWKQSEKGPVNNTGMQLDKSQQKNNNYNKSKSQKERPLQKCCRLCTTSCRSAYFTVCGSWGNPSSFLLYLVISWLIPKQINNHRNKRGSYKCSRNRHEIQ